MVPEHEALPAGGLGRLRHAHHGLRVAEGAEGHDLDSIMHARFLLREAGSAPARPPRSSGVHHPHSCLRTGKRLDVECSIGLEYSTTWAKEKFLSKIRTGLVSRSRLGRALVI